MESRYFYSSPLDDANDFRFTALNIKEFKGRKCVIPYIICLSFSLELYIKSILIANKIRYESKHSLKKLFELVPSDIKNDLLEKNDKLIDVIEEYDESFVEFRYHYEIYDKKNKNKNKIMRHFDGEKVEEILQIFHDYCNEKYLCVEFDQCLMDMGVK